MPASAQIIQAERHALRVRGLADDAPALDVLRLRLRQVLADIEQARPVEPQAIREALRLAFLIRGLPEDGPAIESVQDRLTDALRIVTASAPPARQADEDRGVAEGLDVAEAQDIGRSPAGVAERVTHEQPPQQLAFEQLIGSLGRAVAKAQRALDDESLKYRLDIENRRQDGVPSSLAGMPTLYRMPSVKAGFKFSVEKMSEEGFDVVIWRDRDQTRTGNQQTVDLEIVAVPLPPEVGPSGALGPSVGLILDPGRRAPILRGLGADDADVARREEIAAVRSVPNHVLLLRASPGADDLVLALTRALNLSGSVPDHLYATLLTRHGDEFRAHKLGDLGSVAGRSAALADAVDALISVQATTIAALG